MGGDGLIEVILTRSWVSATREFHEQLAIKSDGSDTWWWGPVLDGNTGTSAVLLDKSGAVSDLDVDGLCDAISTHFAHDAEPREHKVTALSGVDGTPLWSSSIDTMTVVRVLPCDPVVADVRPDSSGVEVICGVRTLRCLSRNGHLIWSTPVSGYIAGIAVSDLNSSGELEIVVATYGSTANPEACLGRLYVFAADGGVIDLLQLDYPAKAPPVIADLDNDGQREVLSTSSCLDVVTQDSLAWVSHLDIVTYTQSDTLASFALQPRPLFFWGDMTSAPCVADVDRDGTLDVVVVDGLGIVHCLNGPGWSGEESPSWGSYQHDERRTGTLETPVGGSYPPQVTASWWGDYLVTSDVTIDVTSSLLVQPGTTVRARPDDEIELVIDGGTLNVGGDPLRPVIFESKVYPPLGSGANWRGIRLGSHSSSSISNAIITDAYIGIDAADSLTLAVRGCTLSGNELAGIRCVDDSNEQSTISLRHNYISGAQIGIDLDSCAADTVSDSTIEDCSAYGIRIADDYGSTITGNTVTTPVPNLTFSGIRVDGSHGDLVLARNTIGDSQHGIPNTAMEYRNSGSTDAGIIKDNTIIVSAWGKGTGMYFSDANPTVRANTLTGKHFYTAFGIVGTPAPNLGEAVGVSCECDSDTTLAGCNRVVPDDDPANWYVWSACPDTVLVMAQCNYWDPAPDSTKFYGEVVWQPYLRSDPGGGRGEAEQEGAEDVPRELVLLPNTPNPFNPETEFRFGLPCSEHVRLDVYDLAGRHICTLVNDHLSAGWQKVRWDGRGDAGQRVASGVYFCRLQTEGSSVRHKVVVLK